VCNVGLRSLYLEAVVLWMVTVEFVAHEDGMSALGVLNQAPGEFRAYGKGTAFICLWLNCALKS